jgi:SAM-dependent methyltransferase
MQELFVILTILLLLLSLTYIGRIVEEKIKNPMLSLRNTTEGFEDKEEEVKGAYDESKGVVKYLDNDELYDSFTASIYDQLTQGSVRTQAEIGLILHKWTKRGDDLKNFEVLDAGCGTGVSVAALSKIGCKKVVGLDKSAAMIQQAKNVTIPSSTLTEEQKKNIEWRTADLLDPSSCAGGEFSHACMLYFTIYYFPDKEAVFRNLFLWIKPGGHLVVQVVNKHKFDPMLESSSPWLGFSLQKYSKERITKSEVTFNKFKYTGEFDLQDPAAEYRETFRFTDGKVRRQRHTWQMEDINTIIGFAKVAGWEYEGFVDLTPVQFEYAYHLHFKHP